MKRYGHILFAALGVALLFLGAGDWLGSQLLLGKDGTRGLTQQIDLVLQKYDLSPTDREIVAASSERVRMFNRHYHDLVSQQLPRLACLVCLGGLCMIIYSVRALLTGKKQRMEIQQ